MRSDYADKPIKELVTGWDWIKALHDFRYQQPLDDGAVRKWLNTVLESRMIHTSKKQDYRNDKAALDEWIRSARDAIEFTYNAGGTSSLKRLLNTQPRSPNNQYDDPRYKSIFVEGIFHDLPEFLKILIVKDKELRSLFGLPNSCYTLGKTRNNKYSYQWKDENVVFNKINLELKPQHLCMLRLAESSSAGWVLEKDLLKNCCGNNSDRPALQQAISALRKKFVAASNKQIEGLDLIHNGHDEYREKGYYFNLVKESLPE